MNEFRSNKLDYIWLMVVLLHVIGSSMITLFMAIPYGVVLLNSLFWLYIGYCNKDKKMAIVFFSVLWSISMYAMNHMIISYLVPLLMNMMIFFYYLYLHYGRVDLLVMDNHIQKPTSKEIITFLPFTLLLFIISKYINDISMLFFQNHVSSSLVDLPDHLISGFFALAILPAIVEELIYRGLVFKRLGNSPKAIILSACMFALCHMNFNQMCYAFVMGLLFAIIFYVSDNLLMTMMIHMSFNGYTVLSNAFAESGIVHWMNQLHIGPYHLFGGALLDPHSNDFLASMLIGFLVMLLAALGIAFLLKFIKGEKEIVMRESKEKGRLGFAYYLGIAICIFVAICMK